MQTVKWLRGGWCRFPTRWRISVLATFVLFFVERPMQAQRAALGFSHGDHRGQACASCHSSRVRHGELIVRSAQDCQRCHHTGPRQEQCAACHGSVTARRGAAPERSFTLAAGGRTVTRPIRFDHQRHATVACTQCHSARLTRAPESADCAACHAQHHGPTADCTTCHGAANALATHRRADHTGCAAAQCHGQRAAGLPASREACLVCHSAQTAHMPGRACYQCHRVAGVRPTTP
jgi:hypothetical protein